MIKTRLGAANKCFCGLVKHLSSKLLSRKIKCVIYKALIRLILTYGSRFGLWVNKASIFLGPSRGKFWEEYLAQYLKMDVGGGVKTLKYITSMMNMKL
jgi:hypothetical protein